ncbi:M23 family metallopeptidase [Teredinibacter sp. KSP-S5-2]|uniref:M23 family metallopeptidase n=1 Tax=Teredinibacter sp. KSP-S5-2 TaxID=3034506 RepID=UPI0029341D8E|nr:M23 family metallopeptidase [Teredinibacter sp. KSP-S5-2]WNO08625.1 M23 family metallopeptidase [Teredinibacter sp. KSP-S5-2]
MLGQRFAYDFFQIDWSQESGYKWYRSPKWRSRLFGVPLIDSICYSQPIYSPFDAEVVETYDGLKERDPVHFLRDLFSVLKNGLTLNASCNADLIPALGNYIILKNHHTYCLIAHAKCGSIKVSTGDKIHTSQKLAEVGHSGNSTAPHLHFQLMDNPDLLRANGIPCSFISYEIHKDGKWTTVRNGVPGRRERIRA